MTQENKKLVKRLKLGKLILFLKTETFSILKKKKEQKNNVP